MIFGQVFPPQTQMLFPEDLRRETLAKVYFTPTARYTACGNQPACNHDTGVKTLPFIA